MRNVMIGRATIAEEGGTLATDLKPGDKVRNAESWEMVGIVNVHHFRSEGADMVRLELHGDAYALMPASLEAEAECLDTTAFSERLAATVGL